MKLWDGVHLSAMNLYKSPVRTLLTVLGLGVGIAAILTVVTLGRTGEEQVETEIARLGVNKVWITPGANTQLNASDGEAISLAVHAPACAAAYTAAPVAMNGRQVIAQLSGYDSNAAEVHGLHVLEGRMFLPSEYAEGASVALVDETLANQLGGDVVGNYLDVGIRRVVVIGIAGGSVPQALVQSSGTVMLPLRTLQDTFSVPVSEITVHVPQDSAASDIRLEALAALQDGDYQALTLEEEINAAREVVRIFVMVLACVAAVCMLTGAIGVMNILLVSVRERRNEIGLLKAIGGTSAQVGLLFLLEAAGYSALGCLLGLGLGAVLIAICGSWIGLNASMEVRTAAVVMAGTLAMGVAFGVLPAVRAARMQPVDALREE